MLITSDDWERIIESGKVLEEVDNVHVVGCPDIFYFVRQTPFPNVLSVTFERCNKNFVFYHLQEGWFPKAKEIYLLSHPCEPSVLHRFPTATFHLGKDMEMYKNRWAPNRKNLFIV
jgi:hypothetical protein